MSASTDPESSRDRANGGTATPKNEPSSGLVRKRGRQESPIILDDDEDEIMQASSRERKKRKTPREAASAPSTSTPDRDHTRDHTPGGSDLMIIHRDDDADETDFDDFGGPKVNFRASYALAAAPSPETARYTQSTRETYASVDARPAVQKPQKTDGASAAFRSTTKNAGPSELELTQLGHAHIFGMKRVMNEQWGEIHRLSDQLDAQRNEKTGLQARLEEERQKHLQEKQEVVLNQISMQEKFNKDLERLKKEIASLQRIAERRDVEIERLEVVADKNEDAARQRQTRIIAMENHIVDVEARLDCAHRGNHTKDKDMAELRRMHLEDASRIERQKQGLPPAYGNLDEESPPWDQHQDAGQYRFTTWEFLVRSRFQQQMRAVYDRLRSREGDNRSTTTILFHDGFMVIKRSCNLLHAAFKLHKAAHGGGNSATVESELVKVPPWDSLPADKAILGRAVASVVLEMPMDIVSGYQLCSGDLEVTRTEKTNVALCWQELDDVLLKALRLVFSGAENETPLQYRAFALQRYLTQTEMVKEGLSCYGEENLPQVFEQSRGWLNEQIEAVRVLAAAAVAAAAEEAA